MATNLLLQSLMTAATNPIKAQLNKNYGLGQFSSNIQQNKSGNNQNVSQSNQIQLPQIATKFQLKQYQEPNLGGSQSNYGQGSGLDLSHSFDLSKLNIDLGNNQNQVENINNDVKSKDFSANVSQEDFSKLSEGGKAFVRLSEKRKWLADQIRNKDKIPSNITDAEIIEDFTNQKGASIFEEDLKKLNENQMTDQDTAIINGKPLKGNLSKTTPISYSKVQPGFEEMGKIDKLKAIISNLATLNKLPGKKIENPLDAPEAIGRALLNIPATVRDATAFVVNGVINPREAGDMLKQLPQGLASIAENAQIDIQKQGFIQGTRNLIDNASVFLQENPDIVLPAFGSEAISKVRNFSVLDEAKAIGNKIKSTIDNLGKAPKTIEVGEDIAKYATDLYKTGEVAKPIKGDFDIGYTSKGEEIQVPKQSLTNKLLGKSIDQLTKTDNFGNTELTRLANRAVMPTSVGKGTQMVQIPKKTEQGLKTAWELQRTGKIEGKLDTMQDVGKLIVDGLDKYGKELGEIRSKAFNDSINTKDIAQKAENVINTNYKSIVGEEGYGRLKQFYDDFNQGNMNFKDLFEIKTNLGAELTKLRKSGNSGTSTYVALKEMNDLLGTKIDKYLSEDIKLSGPELERYREANRIYSDLKNISDPFLKSMLVDARRSQFSLAEQIALMQQGYLDFITSPVKATAGAVGRNIVSEIAKRNTREGAMTQFFDGLDLIAKQTKPSNIKTTKNLYGSEINTNPLNISQKSNINPDLYKTIIGEETMKNTPGNNILQAEAFKQSNPLLKSKKTSTTNVLDTGLKNRKYFMGSDDLIQEARKYKSAEEFIKSQPTVYHGTDIKFEKFNTNKGAGGLIWFTSNKKDIESGMAGAKGSKYILERKLYLKNPAGWKDWENLTIDELKSKGYDGAILPSKSGNTYVAFDVKNIKTNDELKQIRKEANK